MSSVALGFTFMLTVNPLFKPGNPRLVGQAFLSEALKQLSEVVLDLNVHLSVIYIPSGDNLADQQKSSLQKELESFLASFPFPTDISTAPPRDLCRFLVWKDQKGKTKLHNTNCQFFAHRGLFPCPCPTSPLAYGTVDSLIGKL